jgi:hypothetical protein
MHLNDERVGGRIAGCRVPAKHPRLKPHYINESVTTKKTAGA